MDGEPRAAEAGRLFSQISQPLQSIWQPYSVDGDRHIAIGLLHTARSVRRITLSLDGRILRATAVLGIQCAAGPDHVALLCRVAAGSRATRLAGDFIAGPLAFETVAFLGTNTSVRFILNAVLNDLRRTLDDSRIAWLLDHDHASVR